MSKTAQRKRSAYELGYKTGLKGIPMTVSKKWYFRKEFLNGVREGRAERHKRAAPGPAFVIEST